MGVKMLRDKPTQFSVITVVLHWLIALTVIGMLAVGVYMTENKVFSLYGWHKSIGVLIFSVILLRVLWRWYNGWPVPAGHHSKAEISLARFIHWVLIIGTVLMPLSGFLMSSLGGNGVSVFGWELVARNPDPLNPRQVIAHNETLAAIFKQVHEYVGYTLIGAVVLHISGGLKHHLMDKDGTLRRMLGKPVSQD